MFKQITRNELKINPFTSIGNEWMLISAKKNGITNTMTASWGEMGHLWNQDVVTVFIRHSRYTKEFVDSAKEFSISFFDEKKEELTYLGRNSGRDGNKINHVNFHTTDINGIPTFEEAKLVFTLKTLYTDDLKKENFLDSSIPEKCYTDNDYHTVYIAKVTGIYINE